MESAASAASRPSKKRSTRSALACARKESSPADRRPANSAIAACIRNASSNIVPARPPCRSYWKPFLKPSTPAVECADRAREALADKLEQTAEDSLLRREVAQGMALRCQSPPHKGSRHARHRNRTALRRYRCAPNGKPHSRGAPREQEKKRLFRSAPSAPGNESNDLVFQALPAALPGTLRKHPAAKKIVQARSTTPSHQSLSMQRRASAVRNGHAGRHQSGCASPRRSTAESARCAPVARDR